MGYRGFDLTRENGKVMYNLFMEYVAGGSLGDEIVRRGGRIKEAAAGFYTRQIVRGLEYLHARGLVHCDIKARNILVGEDGVKIADFGCSKWVSQPAAIGGTPMFMAPEVARGEEQGFSSDIWALGCTLIEMVTGGPPWPDAGNPVSVLHRIGYSGESPEIPSFLSDPAKDFLGKCLRRDARERWSASQLLGHPFLGELSCGSEEIKELHSDSHSNSPTSILDQGLWNSLEEQSSEAVEKSARWDDDRIRQLSMTSGEFRWELGDENWITIREESNRSSVESDSIFGSTSEMGFRRDYGKCSQLLDTTVRFRLRKNDVVISDLSSNRDRANLSVHLISKF